MKYDKDEIKSKLTTEMVFDIVNDFGGEPRKTDFGFISATICHNEPGVGSHKLYYYENTALFRCWTGCDTSFDIFELLTKIHESANWGLYDAVKWVASKYGWGPTIVDNDRRLDDWKIFDKYEKLHNIKVSDTEVELQAYDPTILKNLSYPVIADWVDEGISRAVLKSNQIGYYPAGEQITIPHFDIHGRFIGLRGRALGEEEAERYGKYCPLIVGKQMYNHPLGYNLYNINNSAENIKRAKMAIVGEGEKFSLLYQTYFGKENDISVACCGSSITSYQMSMLLKLGVKEIVIAFDKQFKEKNDKEFQHWVKGLRAIHNRYNQYVTISFMFDTENLLPYKASPIDCGKDIFLELFKKRIIL